MPRPFIVLSLPRSRSAWLAHFLTGGNEFWIGHDISVECGSISDFLGMYAGGMVGTCETGVILGWRLIRHLLPSARIVTLHRPLAEIEASLAKFGIGGSALHAELELREGMLEVCSRFPSVRRVEFAELDDPEVCRSLYEHLLESPLDPDWYARMASVNVQVNMLHRSTRLWLNRERQARMKAEVEARLAVLPQGDSTWMT